MQFINFTMILHVTELYAYQIAYEQTLTPSYIP